MSHENVRTSTSNPDSIDQLLTDTFDQALNVLGQGAQVDLVEITMRRIVAAQRKRAILFALLGILAAAICILTSLPLLTLIQTFFSELTSGSGLAVAAEGVAGWQNNLPVLVLTLAVAAGGGWLLLEEAF